MKTEFKIWQTLYYTNWNIPILWKCKITEIIYDWDKVSNLKLDIRNPFWQFEHFSPNGIHWWNYSPNKEVIMKKFIKWIDFEKWLIVWANYYWKNNKWEFCRWELVSYKRFSKVWKDEYRLYFRFWIQDINFTLFDINDLSNKFLNVAQLKKELKSF